MKEALEKYLKQKIVVDTRSSWIYLGILENVLEGAVELSEVDVHENNDTATTKEVYVIESKGAGVIPNRNRVFINGHLATLSLLKSIGEQLADIHGQQEQKSLLDLPTHLQWLDHYGRNQDLLKEVQRRYKALSETARSLNRFEADREERIRRIEILQFQLDEIHRVAPLPNERADLERENSVLSNSEKIIGGERDLPDTIGQQTC